MAYWLLKSEPDVFGWDHLLQCKDQREPWDGIRNYQARNFIRDQMRDGDQGFFYHSNCKQPGIVGIVTILGDARPDPTAFDPDCKYHDPKSDPDNPRWFLRDVQAVRPLQRPVTLQELKARAEELGDFPLVRRGNRLSVMPVSDNHWHMILQLEAQPAPE